MPHVPGERAVSDALHEVRQDQYTTVIREMIRHENDLTNHRIMWLLIGQGFIATAFVSATTQSALTAVVLLRGGILLALSAFLMLYKSYQARGYLQFLGLQAKRGALREGHLPLLGWPRQRIKGWRKEVWICPWFGHAGDLLEPWMFLPYLFAFMWMTILLQTRTTLNVGGAAIVAAILSAAMMFACCVVLVWSQRREECLSAGSDPN
jgi:FtsH-binding integral membrane protein